MVVGALKETLVVAAQAAAEAFAGKVEMFHRHRLHQRAAIAAGGINKIQSFLALNPIPAAVVRKLTRNQPIISQMKK